MGIDIKAQFPKNPDIIIKNDLKIKKDKLKKILMKKITDQVK